MEILLYIMYDHVNIPLEALRMISGFAAVVAICVTQPECPLRVPLSFSCSVILLQREDGKGY